jgi:hypothetical protein
MFWSWMSAALRKTAAPLKLLQEEPNKVRATADVVGQCFGDNCHNLVHSCAVPSRHVMSIEYVRQVLLPEVAIKAQVESGVLVGGHLGLNQYSRAVLEGSHELSPRIVEDLVSLVVLESKEHSKSGS